MAVISPSPLSQSIQASLRRDIAVQTRQGTVSVADELMGYSLAGQRVAQFYSPSPQETAPRRIIAAPEILTGQVRSLSA